MCLLTRPYTDIQSFDGSHGNVARSPQVASFRNSSRPITPSLVPGLGSAEFPPLTPSQLTTVTETTTAKFVKPAVPIIQRSEATKNVATTSSTVPNPTVQNKDDQSLTANDSAIVSHNDSSKTEVASTADATPSVLKTVNQNEARTETPPQDELTTTTNRPISISEPESKMATKVANDDLSTLPGAKSLLSSAQEDSTTFPSNNQETPETNTVIPVRNPRTLRLVTAVKTEDSSTSSTPADTGTTTSGVYTPKPMAQDIDHPSTRQPSTPVAETISEDASLASASASQPGTPNPNARVHAGPSITKSKNQIKKERQARAKQLEETRAEEVSLTDESVQAPIIARKKKTKKANPVTRTPNDTQMSSAASERQPDSAQISTETESIPILGNQNGATANAEPSKSDRVKSNKDDEVQATATQRPKLTGSSMLATLKAEGILDARNLEYFLNPSGLNTRHDVNTNHIFGYDSITELTEEEKETLDRGDSIVKQLNPNEWGVVLPDRSVLRFLSKEEACRYRDLKLKLGRNHTDTFNNADYPRDAWMNLNGNDILAGAQVAPSLDDMQNNHSNPNSDTTKALLDDFKASLLRPDEKDISYGALHPPRDQADNEEIEARMSMYKLEQAEEAVKAAEKHVLAARKKTEPLEKELKELVKKNRKILKD